MNYCEISGDKESIKHLTNLLNWLIEEVLSACGDGDGIWYSKYYSVNDIFKHVIPKAKIPKGWSVKHRENESIVIGEGQEWLEITNDRTVFDTRPNWQQVSIEY